MNRATSTSTTHTTVLSRGVSLLLAAAGVALGIGLGTGAPPLAKLRRYETDPIVGTPIVGNRVAFREFIMRDSVSVYGTQYFLPSRGTIIMLHGLGAHDALALQAGDSLRRVSGMNVLFVDLRGNGRSGGARGRLAHDDQYSEDIGVVIMELKRANPSGPVLLLGVRQGAGQAIEYVRRAATSGARNRELPGVQGLGLLEPVLSIDTLQRAGTQDGGALQWHERRLRTQRLLNRIGVHIADRLPVAYQRAQRPDGPIARNYSWRAIRTLLPDDPWTVANAAPLPVLLLSAAASAQSPLRPSDQHEVATIPATTSLFTSATWRVLERWTAQFSADAALSDNILPFVPIPLTDSTSQ